MKKFFSLLAFALIINLFTIRVQAQTAVASMNKGSFSLKEFIGGIEKQTGYLFVYGKNINIEEKIRVGASRKQVKQILDEVLPQVGLTYEYADNYISLKKAQAETKSTGKKIIAKGIIVDKSGEPVIGANVMEKGSAGNGTITDIDGNFTLSLPSNGTLSVTFVGFTTKNIPVNGKNLLRIILEEDSEVLDEVVVVAYGTQKKISSTAAISSMKTKDVAQKPVINISNSLAGRMAGVIAKQGSGEPGADGADLRIRGVATLGNQSPLVIVDGVPRDFSRIDPNMIEDITILKDAAAVAPYGMAGANGVVLVTTKKGKSGAPVLSYNGYVGFQNPTRLTDQVNSYEYALMKNEAAMNAGYPNYYAYSQHDLEMYRKTSTGAADADPDRYPNSNGLRDLVQGNSAITSHNLQLSGGSDKFQYYVSMGYAYQEGMWSTTDYQRFNVLTNLSVDATKYTKVSLSLSGWHEKKNSPGAESGDIMYQAYRTPPVSAIQYSNGLWGQYVGKSLYGLTYHSGYRQEPADQLNTSLSVEQQLPFIKGLSLKGVINYDPYRVKRKKYFTPIPVYTLDASKDPYQYTEGFQGPEKPNLEQSFEESVSMTYQGMVNYAQTFGKHTITALGVIEARERNVWNMSAKRLNYNIDMDEINAGSSNPADIGNGGTSWKERQVGYAFRLGYNYNNRYMAEVSGRYDGHYYFAPGKRFGFFPALSLGWNLREESFMQDIKWMDKLKFRLSYGESGNLAGSSYQYMSDYGFGTAGNLGGVPVTGMWENLQGNPNITWEKAKKFDFGVEFSMLNGMFSLEADYFYEKRSNMLMAPNALVPAEYGIPLSQVNAGRMHNQGVDLALNFNKRIDKDWMVSLKGTFTFARNILDEVFETDATYNNPNRRRTGRPDGTMFGYHALGYFTYHDFNPDGSLKADIPVQPWGQVYPGDLRYEDLNGPDGTPDGKIDEYDQTVIGYSNWSPEIIFGLAPTIQWKNFDLNALFQGAARTSISLGETLVMPFFDSGSATKLQLNDHWTPDNPNARYPRLTSEVTVNNHRQGSSWWVRDATYIRLKSIELGYTLPRSALNFIGISSARVYASGQNLWTWTPFMKELVDPEAKSANGKYYMQQAVYAFGLNVTF